jgi:DNA-binding response OmpR family regulator
LLEQQHYDLVLLDIEMDGIDGFELSKRLRLLPGHLKTPVIFVTLHGDFETRAKTIESGGDDLIAKPLLPAELAVKTVMHLLKTQMLTIPAPDSLSHETSHDTQVFDREATSHPQYRHFQRKVATPNEVNRPAARQPKPEEEHQK